MRRSRSLYGAWVPFLLLVTLSGIAFTPFASAQDPEPSEVESSEASTSSPEQAIISLADRDSTPELFIDPKIFQIDPGAEVRPRRRITPPQERRVREMANNNTQIDERLIRDYVNYNIVQFTTQEVRDEVRNPSNRPSREILVDKYLKNLTVPLKNAFLNDNRRFLVAYQNALRTELVPFLEMNPLARIEAMTVLSQTRDPQLLDVFLAAINDPDQLVWVQLKAIQGVRELAITRERGGGNAILNTSQQAAAAAEQLANYLQNNPDVPWIVRLRALDALGYIRESTVAILPPDLKIARTLLEIVTDRRERLENRARAVWALGMLRIDNQIRDYNFGLVAYLAGITASDLTVEILQAYESSTELARQITGLLIFSVLVSFEGERDPDLSASGLLRVRPDHPNIGQSQEAIQTIYQGVSELSQASYRFVFAGPEEVNNRRQILKDTLAEFRVMLAKQKPESLQIDSGGEPYDMPIVPSVPQP